MVVKLSACSALDCAANATGATRKSLLTGYVSGWLLPEHRFWAHRPLYEAATKGDAESVAVGWTPELADLLGFGPTDGSAPGGGAAASNHQCWVHVLLCARHCSLAFYGQRSPLRRCCWSQVALQPQPRVGPHRGATITVRGYLFLPARLRSRSVAMHHTLLARLHVVLDPG
eukprot:SAG22_NODE_2395_length_2620_cov_1.102737_2_plen_172_part_00